ncbi:MAG: T9SS type A sorting domain-containing protein [candidate division Zixibacteria bacterium]|nr:T9SS type A sorting domain-containing protein [candidate division Zixibacteria bacterium]
MKTIRFSILFIVLTFGLKVQAQDFIIGAILDPYSGNETAAAPYIQEYFDSLKAFGINRLIGWGDSVTTFQGKANSFGRFKVIPYNSIGFGAKEWAVTFKEPKTLERFTTFGWHITLEAELPINESNLKNFGYGFDHPIGVLQGGIDSVEKTANSIPGYLFAGPGQVCNGGSSGIYFSPHFMNPGTWGRADYVLKLGTDTAGVSDTAVVARLVVYNANVYRFPGGCWWPSHLINSATCDSDRSYPIDSIYLCHDTLVDTTLFYDLPLRCGKRDTYRLRYDDPVLLTLDTVPNPDKITSVAEAFVRDLRKNDFCRAGQWETLSVHFYQPLDYPYQYSLYWNNRVTLTADRVIVSNDTGRVLFAANPDAIRDTLAVYYSTLQDTIPQQYLTDEPYGGSYPILRKGSDLISSPSSAFKPTSIISGYTAPPVSVYSYQWDLVNSIVNPNAFQLQVYPIGCKMLPDSTTNSTDSCSIQLGFESSNRNLGFLSSRAKQPQINKPFWPWVQLFGIWSGLENGKYKQFLRIPTYTEVKAQVNLALAYGAKGVLYFQYTSTGVNPPADTNLTPLLAQRRLVDLDGGTGGTGCPSCSTRTEAQGRPYRISGVMHWNGTKHVQSQPLWDSVRSINVNILKKLGPTVMTLTWDTAGPGSNASGSTRGFLNSVTSDKFPTSSMFVEIAHFTGGGADYFMLVNRRCKPHESQTVTSWLNRSDGSMWYVMDVSSGDTVLTGGTTGGAPFTTSLKAAEGKLFKVAPAPQYISNNVAFPLTWQGKITLDGDVTVSSGKTLKVLPPKAQLSFLANRDTTHSGGDTAKSRIIINGMLNCLGTRTDSIILTSSAASPTAGDWGGIFIGPTGRADVAFTRFSFAETALVMRSDTGTVKVRNSTFTHFKTRGVYSTSTKADLGKSTPTTDCGRNNILLNTADTAAVGVQKAGTGTMSAVGNWWTSDPPPSNSVLGSVSTFAYFSYPANPDSACPGGGGGGGGGCGDGPGEGPCAKITVVDDSRPSKFELAQNYPNPFNAATVIRFALPQASRVELRIYNILGQIVRSFIEEKPVGWYEAFWDGRDENGAAVSSGIYLYQIRAGSYVETKKMHLVK